MKIAILGYDVEGRASYDYFAAQGGHDIVIHDQKTEIQIPDGVASVLGPSYLDDLDRYDLLVRTVGLPPAVILQKNPDVTDKITSHINEFLKVCSTRNVIGVTGTKGKGTTSTLITKMLAAAGKQVELGGNIGIPPLTFLNKLSIDSWVVLELSSFQLSDVKLSPHIGVCLMVVPEHLDWHPNLEGYVHAKSLMFEHQTSNDIAIYFADNETSKQIAQVGAGQKIPYYAPPGAVVEAGAIKIDSQTICQTAELKLLGKHNWQNACAAVTTVWQVTQDVQAIRSVLTSFSGLEHRLEFVREVDGVRFYNDSFAATPDAAIAALETLPQPKVLVAGGFDRGLPLEHLAQAIADHADNLRRVILVGASGPRLARELKYAGFDNYTLETAQDMPTIVAKARSAAQGGDAVILSPGFASFDMFKNFADRGSQFKQAVNAL